MSSQEKLFRLYQDEFQALRDFVSRYSLENRHAGLRSQDSHEDPDVRRLLESLAFFAARTHENALRHVDDFRIRLYQQLFSYLLTKLPPVGVMKAEPTAALNEMIRVERGSELLLTTESDQRFFFITRATINIYPFSIHTLTTEPIEPFGYKISLHFRSRYTLYSLPKRLSIYLDYIGDVLSSFAVMGLLRTRLSEVKLKMGGHAADEHGNNTFRLPPPTFGAISAEVDEEDFLHPMEDERLFFRDPRSELFMHLEMPEIKDAFNSFRIDFEFSTRWPRGLVPNVDLFNLNCVPVVNLRRSMSDPMQANGTITRFPIFYPNSEYQFELFKPIGIYKCDPEGMTPLTPGILGDEDGSYELGYTYAPGSSERRYHIDVHMPSSFFEPVPVFADVMWTQPYFYKYRDEAGNIVPYNRIMHGVNWGWIALPDTIPDEAQVHLTSDEILGILAMSHKRFYSFSDLRALLHVYGPLDVGPMRLIYGAFKGSRYELRLVEGDQLTAGYVIYFLDFDWEQFDSENDIFSAFLRHFESVLNHWSAERQIRLALEGVNQ